MFELHDTILVHGIRKVYISHHGAYQDMTINLYYTTLKSMRLLKIIGCSSHALNFAL